MSTSPYTLGASATLTGTFLNVSIEYGDKDFLHPEFVQRIDLAILNDQGLTLREMHLTTDGQSSDGEGRFRLGLVLDGSEEPKTATIAIQSDTYGPVQAKIPVKQDTNRAIQGS